MHLPHKAAQGAGLYNRRPKWGFDYMNALKVQVSFRFYENRHRERGGARRLMISDLGINFIDLE